MKEWVLTKQSFDINFVSCVHSYRAENAWISQLEHSRPLKFYFHLHTASLLSRGHKRHCIWYNKTLSHSFWQVRYPFFFSFPKKQSLALLLKKLSYAQSHQTSCSLDVYFILGISFTRNSLLLLAKGLLVLQDSSPDRANPFWKLSWIAQVEFVSQIPCALLLFSTYYCITIGELSVSILFTSPFPKPGVSAWHRKRCQDFISEFSY